MDQTNIMEKMKMWDKFKTFGEFTKFVKENYDFTDSKEYLICATPGFPPLHHLFDAMNDYFKDCEPPNIKEVAADYADGKMRELLLGDSADMKFLPNVKRFPGVLSYPVNELPAAIGFRGRRNVKKKVNIIGRLYRGITRLYQITATFENIECSIYEYPKKFRAGLKLEHFPEETRNLRLFSLKHYLHPISVLKFMFREHKDIYNWEAYGLPGTDDKSFKKWIEHWMKHFPVDCFHRDMGRRKLAYIRVRDGRGERIYWNNRFFFIALAVSVLSHMVIVDRQPTVRHAYYCSNQMGYREDLAWEYITWSCHQMIDYEVKLFKEEMAKCFLRYPDPRALGVDRKVCTFSKEWIRQVFYPRDFFRGFDHPCPCKEERELFAKIAAKKKYLDNELFKDLDITLPCELFVLLKSIPEQAKKYRDILAFASDESREFYRMPLRNRGLPILEHMISACGFAFADCIRYVTYNLRSFLKMYVTLEIVFWREGMWHKALVREVNDANKIIREYNANLDALREEERLNFIIFEMLCENKTKREARDYDGYSKNFDPLKYDHRGFVSIHKRVREIPLPK